jgi:hypothetical protein
VNEIVIVIVVLVVIVIVDVVDDDHYLELWNNTCKHIWNTVCEQLPVRRNMLFSSDGAWAFQPTSTFMWQSNSCRRWGL